MDIVQKISQIEQMNNHRWSEVTEFAQSTSNVLNGMFRVIDKQEARIAALEAAVKVTKKSGGIPFKKIVVAGIVIAAVSEYTSKSKPVTNQQKGL